MKLSDCRKGDVVYVLTPRGEPVKVKVRKVHLTHARDHGSEREVVVYLPNGAIVTFPGSKECALHV